MGQELLQMDWRGWAYDEVHESLGKRSLTSNDAQISLAR